MFLFGTAPRWIQEIATQANRCKHLAACLSNVQRGKAGAARLAALQKDISCVREAILKFTAAEATSPGHVNQGLGADRSLHSKADDLTAALSDAESTSFKCIFALGHAAVRYAAIHRAQLQRFAQAAPLGVSVDLQSR